MPAEPDDPVFAALLARHRAVLTRERPALLRSDQLMVRANQLASVPVSVRRWLEDPAPPIGGMHRLRLRAAGGADVLDVVAAGPDSNPVMPIHLLRAAPRWRGGPAGPPVIIAEGPPPPRAPDPDAPVVEVAVLDTGITPHPWFRQRSWFSRVPAVELEVLDADHDHRLDAVAGHGTFIAGIVQQHAPSAVLSVHRVLGSDGVCDELDLIEVLHRLRHSPAAVPQVVNLSFGGFTHNDLPTAVVAEEVADLARTAVLVAAAGNDGTDRPFWPAAFDDVIAVGALDCAGSRRAGFSNHGDWVDAYAVGEDVRGAFVASGRNLPADVERPGQGCFAMWSGTSFAAPAVCGRIAALAVEAGLDIKQAARRLLASEPSVRSAP